MTNGSVSAKKSVPAGTSPAAFAPALADSELKYRRLFEAAQDGILLLNANTAEIEDANPFLEDLLGYRHDELVGKKLWDIGFPQDVLASREAFKKLRREEVIRYEDLPLKAKDGRKIDARFISNLYSVGDRDVVQCNIRDITESKRAVELRREAESRYRLVFEGGPLGIAVVDPDLRFLRVNRKFCELLDYSEAELSGKTFRDVTFADDLAGSDEQMVRLIKGDIKSFAIEKRYQTSSGELLWAHTFVSVARDDGGKIIFFQAVIEDISERKLVESELLETEEKFAAAFQASPNLMVITRLADGMILDVNDGFTRLLGYSRAESIRRPTSELNIWAEPADRVAWVARLQKDGLVMDFETTLRRKDGTLITVLNSGKTLKLSGGDCILSVAHDISERKRNEGALRKDEAELKEAQRIGHFGNFDWDARTDVIVWSDEYYRIYGFTPGTKPPGYEEHLKVYSPESAARLDVVVKRSMQTGEPYEVDLEQVRPDGTRKWLTARGEVKRDSKGAIVGLRGTAQDITDRKEAAEALRKAEADFRLLAENSLDIISRHDLDGLIIYASPACRTLLGYEPEELVGRRAEKIVHSDDIGAVRKAVMEATTRDAVPPFEVRLRRRDGSYLWVEVLGRPIRDPKTGEVAGFQTMTRDISYRKRLEETSSRLRLAIDRADEAVFMTDKDGLINFVNPKFTALYGWQPNEVVGKTTPRVLKSGRMSDEDYKKFWGTILSGQTASGEMYNKTKYGKFLAVEGSVNPVPDKNGKVIGFLAIQRDVTERKSIEAALAESERHYRTFIENAPDAAFEIDLEGKIIFVGSQLGSHRLPPLSSMGAASVKFADYVVPEDRKRVADAVRQIIDTGERWAAEFRVALPGEEPFWVESLANLHKDDSGKPVSVLGVLRDVTERKRAEERMREVDEIRSRFMQIVAHQLRTPLNSIRWNIETLLADEVGRLSDTQREFVKLVYDAELDVIRRISQMLVAFDIQEQHVFLNREDTSFESLWTSVMAALTRRATLKEMDFRYQPPDVPLPALSIDAEKIREVMLSLTMNSLDYTPNKGRVSVKLSRAGDKVRFEITDTGIGVPAAEQARLFQRFFRASNASVVRQDASGLGLFIARNYVEAHGGKIGLTSKEGKGSMFWFELPLP